MKNFAGIDITDSESEHNVRSSNLLNRLNSDMRFVSIFYIIYGVLACISIIGAVIGIPTIVMGLRLRDSAQAFEAFQAGQSTNALYVALDKQRSFFHIQKIIIAVMLVFLVLYLIGLYFVITSGVLNGFMAPEEYEALRLGSFLTGLQG